MISNRLKKEIARNAADFQAADAADCDAGQRRKLWRAVFDAVVASLNVAEGLLADGLPQPSEN